VAMYVAIAEIPCLKGEILPPFVCGERSQILP
jgi:hypothetical protein